MPCILCHIWTIFRSYSDIFGHIRTIFGHIRTYSDIFEPYSDIFEPYSAHGPGPWAGPWAGPGPGRARAQAKHDLLAYDINKKDAQRPYDPFAGDIAPRPSENEGFRFH